MKLDFLDAQHVSLPVACATILAALNNGKQSNETGTDQILDDVANALSYITTIYVLPRDSVVPAKIAPADLVGGRFSKGGRVFMTRKGVQFDCLSITRGEMNSAIALLRPMHLRFQLPTSD